jgi:hypothetical protein
MPIDSEDAAPRACLGNTFRLKNASTLKLNEGETAKGIDIEIPLSGLHEVSGRVESVADGHLPSRATVKLLYADDRELIRKIAIDEDGAFAFEYVPEDNYILRVDDAVDIADENNKNGALQTERRYRPKEMPVHVQSDLKNLDLTIIEEVAQRQR